MGKAELFKHPALDWLLRQLGGFPVNRGAHDEWAMQHARGVLEHGQVLGIFPEGRRNRGSGLQQAKTGAARLAIEAGCQIVPVALQGTEIIGIAQLGAQRLEDLPIALTRRTAKLGFQMIAQIGDVDPS